MSIIKRKALKKYIKSYANKKIDKTKFEKFSKEFQTLKSQIQKSISENRDEAHYEDLTRDFLKSTLYFDKKYNIYKEDRIDYSIKKNGIVEAIFEFKVPNTSQMISEKKINGHALWQAIKYFYDEKRKGNHYIKQIIITDSINWFVFDTTDFQKNLPQSIKKICDKFSNGETNLSKNETLYQAIGKEISDKNPTFEYTYFNLQNIKNENEILNLYKFLHPEFILKEYDPKDANQLNKNFYSELLWILGLEETKKGLIKPNNNQNAIINEVLEKVEDQTNTSKSEVEETSFELIITWLNRILFLKLFEGQLVAFNSNNPDYKFITSEKIKDFDDLNNLFFEVLGKPFAERKDRHKNENIPYLNSSLFEGSKKEREAFFISSLSNDLELELFSRTSLKKDRSYKGIKKQNTLKYLLDFLDSYDFSSVNTDEDFIDDKKEIINSSVLGLIFEKLNGYKDGSFYTPGFITKYMAGETLKRAVIEKFEKKYNAKYKDLGELKAFISRDSYQAEKREEYNSLINSIKICDPAVGSGHYPVSMLNNIIWLKSYLQLLYTEDNKLVITENEDDNLVIYTSANKDEVFSYKRNLKETLLTQKAIFKEKQSIIENQIFAVDINPKSVYICQLRLWIELLKNTFYHSDGTMEILPNIDINIKEGNSLISKYDIEVGKSILDKVDKRTSIAKIIKEYKEAVIDYKHSSSKQVKRKVNETLAKIKGDITQIVKDVLFSDSKDTQELKKKLKVLEKEKKLSSSLEKRSAIQSEINILIKQLSSVSIGESMENPIYKNSMEWMIEFPELLDDNGAFQGFDIVIGNPPYIKEYTNKSAFDGLRNHYCYQGKMDLWYFFGAIGLDLLKDNGTLSYIAPNNWMTNAGASKLRNKILEDSQILKFIDFGNYKVFENAGIQTMIYISSKSKKNNSYKVKYSKLTSSEINSTDLKNFLYKKRGTTFSKYEKNINRDELKDKYIEFNESHLSKILDKIKNSGNYYLDKNSLTNGIHHHHDYINKSRLELLSENFNIGDGIFVLSEEEKLNMNLNNIEESIIKPTYTTKQIKKYYTNPKNEEYVIYTESSFKDISKIEQYPNIKSHLDKFKDVITSDNKPYGLHRARQERFFKGEKIISVRKCSNGPVFSYSDFDAYVSATFYIIQPTDINLKYLTALLNSKLIAFWLRYKGKMQGNNYQVDKEPLINIPLIKSPKNERKLESLVDKILKAKEDNLQDNTSALEEQIDQLVYKLYDLTAEEIEIVGGKKEDIDTKDNIVNIDFNKKENNKISLTKENILTKCEENYDNNSYVNEKEVANEFDMPIFYLDLSSGKDNPDGELWFNEDINKLEIIINKTKSKTSQRMSVFHEIKHIIDDYERIMNSEFKKAARKSKIHSFAFSNLEFEADDFAGKCLVPIDALARYIEEKFKVGIAESLNYQEGVIKSVAEHFKVSEATADIRLKAEGYKGIR